MTEEQPDWARKLEEASRELQKGLAQAGNILAAQAAMGWAYRGQIENVRAGLKGMGPAQLRELSAASAMLASLADEELSGRG